MSTKIYNGYRITGPQGTRPDPFAVVADARSVLMQAYRTGYARLLAELACLRIDRVGHVADAERPARPVSAVEFELTKARLRIDQTQQRDPLVDFGAEIALLTDPADPTGPLYALLYTEQSSYEAAFESLPGVTPWPYWNNTDRPDDVTDEEWDARRDLWDRLLPAGTSPASRGLSWKLFGTYEGLRAKDIREEIAVAIADVQARAEAVAGQLVNPFETRSDEDGYPVIRRGPEIRAEIAEITARIASTLPALTVDDLWGTGSS